MFGWEIPFGKMIDSARKMELNILRQNSHIRGPFMTLALFTTRLAVFCTMLSICLIYGNENVTAANVTFLYTPIKHKLFQFNLLSTDFRNSCLLPNISAVHVSNVYSRDC